MNFIDFFGGSGLLSQWALEAGFREVVYNDFDEYLGRIMYFNSPRHIEYINWCAGAKVESTDYRELLHKYTINENTVCSIDPPYPNTEQFAYTGCVTLGDIGSLVEECLDMGAKVMVYGNKASGIYDLMTKFPSLKVYEFRLATFNKDPFDYLYRNF